MPTELEICVAPFEVPTDHATALRDARARKPETPADTVRQGLALFNLSQPGELFAPLHVFLRDPETGAVSGGLLGHTVRGAFHITQMWVDEPLRRQRHGSAILARAEHEAKGRGCRFVHVEAYSFHSPSFYERNGYATFGRLVGFSGGHTRFYLRKDLEPELPEGPCDEIG